jgi:hypothetical protein
MRPAATFSRREKPPEIRRPELERPYWWRYEAADKTFRHRATGEELRFVGSLPGEEGTTIWPWYRFDYVHTAEDVAYPLVVQWREGRPEPANGIAQWVDWERAGAVEYEERAPFGRSSFPMWVVDHDRSLALWRRETAAADALPTYGLWRRADLAAIGCGLCVPFAAPTGHHADMVLLKGGWLNGAWRSGFYRRSTWSWNRASGADKAIIDSFGRLKPGAGNTCFFAPNEAFLLPLNASCPVWRASEMKVLWQDPRMDDTAQTVTCMREERTGEVLYVTSWRSFDPLTSKEQYAVDLHYAGYGILARDIADFRHRAAENVLAEPIHISHDFAPGDFVQIVTTPARARFFEVYDIDLARTLIPDLKVSDNMLHAQAPRVPDAIVDWREVRNKPFGSHRLSFTLHEALMHALPFSTGFDLGASTRKATLGERTTFDFRSGETGCSWLYEQSMRLAPRLPSDGDGPGWTQMMD